MNAFKPFTDLNYQPSSLDKDEMERPEKVIDFFFSDFALHDVRRNIWELYKSWTFQEVEAEVVHEMEGMLIFYEQLKNLVDATYALNEKLLKKQFHIIKESPFSNSYERDLDQ